MESKNKFFLKGLELSEKENFAEAINYFNQALGSEENPNIYYERGLAYFHLGDIKASLNDLNTALSLDPENPFRYSSRAFVRDKMGDLEGAMNDYKKAIELDPADAIAHNNLGLLEEKAGFNEMAKKRFITADEIAKNNGLFGNFQSSEKKPVNENSNGPFQPKPFSLTPLKGEKFSLGQYAREIYKVVSNRSAWVEFLRFLKNGGKIKQ